MTKIQDACRAIQKVVGAFCLVLVANPAFATCSSNEIDVTGDGSNCQPVKFTLTTGSTNFFHFKMTAVGTFYVDCGDGGTLIDSSSELPDKVIVRSGTTATNYTCHWSGSESQTIRFGGTATDYAKGVTNAAIRFDENAQDIASISGNLSAIFPYKSDNAQNGAQPRFYRAFYGATSLTSVPDTLFANYTTPATGMFFNTFQNCSSLTTIPAGLFSGISGAADSLFGYTFDGCSALTSIPEDLFEGISGGAPSLFYYTFNNCTSLTKMPVNLFAGVSEAASSMFMNTFSGCTSLSGSIPPSTFAGLIANGSPVAADMWNNTFSNTNLDYTCPAGMTMYDIGNYYGGTNGTTWNGRISCKPDSALRIELDSENGTATQDVYLDYGIGWYTNSSTDTPVYLVSPLPTKADYVFNGFFSGRNGSGVRIVDKNGTFLTSASALNFTTNNTTVYAYWTDCSTGYSATSTGCVPNTIDIVWGGVQSQLSLPEYVRSVTYGDDIYTPSREDLAHRSGFIFRGWEFRRPRE